MNKKFWKSNVGENKNIRSHILSSDKMIENGFTHRMEDNWYFCEMLDDGVSLNIVIADDESFVGIKVLLEEHLEPISREEAEELFGYEKTYAINEKVIQCLKRLEQIGILEGFSV